ncbi:MAG: hypothetical protein L6R38_008570 [Xanthoria sp. 2 TBL-2021]|nr:MAG: hypothetical protein L6R38_008570 [Xanthoria sp. 2 TBL-2021]
MSEGKSIGMSSCCLSGALHEGKPTGRVDNIGGLDTYISEPKGGSKTKSVIFISDIFGWEFPNTRLLADQYALAGFYTYLPDFHEGDSLPISFLQNVEPPLKKQEQLSVIEKATNAAVVPSTLGPWLVKHREAVSKPLIDGFVNTVRMIPGTDVVGAVGFCWGGRYAILQAHGPNLATPGEIGGVDAVFAAHPSLVAVPGDFDPVSRPLSLAFGTKDSLLDEGTRGKIVDLMAGKKEVKHEIRLYEEQVHGFALRSDWSSEKDKKAMDEATRQGIEWMEKYLRSGKE